MFFVSDSKNESVSIIDYSENRNQNSLSRAGRVIFNNFKILVNNPF